MAYIGQKGGTVSTLTSKTLDTMTGDGSDATLTLSQTPASVNDVAVYLDGVFQRPTNEYTLSGNVITFTTAPANGVSVCAVAGGGEHIGSPMAGSVTTDKLIDGTITSAMVATMSSSKLTGALAAVDGSALTGIPSTIIKNASDPANDTNPSGGLGTVWANTTDGEMFVCTDATTDANVWFNVGSGTGDVQPTILGTLFGFAAGGSTTGSNVVLTDIERTSFTTDGNATDVGDITVGRQQPAGATDAIAKYGYMQGGQAGSPYSTVIDRFLMTSGGTATNVGDVTEARRSRASSSSLTHGYMAGGDTPSPYTDRIDKFAFGSSSNSTDVGNITGGVGGELGGGSSTTHGYTMGGTRSSPNTNIIDKYSFSSDGDATDVGDLVVACSSGSGANSLTHIYHTSFYVSASRNDINKFTIASDANATDVGDLTQARHTASQGMSSITHGYISGGRVDPGGGIWQNTIDKFSFVSDANATDVGDATRAIASQGTCQY